MGLTLMMTVGCAMPSRNQPPLPETGGAKYVFVFDDGSHNGFVMPVSQFPLQFERASGIDPLAEAPLFVEFGFSDRKWITGQDRSLDHVLSLLLGEGEGVIAFRFHRSLAGSVPRDGDCHKIMMNREAYTLFVQELLGWLDMTQPVAVTSHADPLYVVASTHPYTLLRNCRHFTERLKRVAEGHGPKSAATAVP